MEQRSFLIGATDLVYLKIDDGITMHQISKDFDFSMGHTLHAYKGDCHRLHGHNYALTVTISSNSLDDNGFVMDFADLKVIVNGILDAELDHHFWVFRDDPRRKTLVDMGARAVAWEPTVENIIEYLAGEIKPKLDRVTLVRLELWETASSKAEWLP